MSTEWRTFDVSGVVVSAEYIWPARSRQDLLPTPDDFGVLFAGADIFDQLGSAPVDQVLVRFDDAVDQATIIADLSTAARRHGATEIETRAQQPSNAALQEDVAGFGELSFMFPALFLSAAGMATFVLLARLVRSQRTQIATLVASGLGVGAVTRHYLAHGVIVTGVSGVIGLAIGVPAGWAITGAHTQAISVPDTVRALHPTTIIIGMVLSLLTGAVAATDPIELSIAGFVDEPMGTFVYSQIDSLPDLGVDSSVMVIYADGVDRESMRVNGYSAPQISRLLAGESLALTVLATIPGLFIGYEISAFLMDSFSSDLFDFGLRIRWTTLAMSGLAVVAVSATSAESHHASEPLGVLRWVRSTSTPLHTVARVRRATTLDGAPSLRRRRCECR